MTRRPFTFSHAVLVAWLAVSMTAFGVGVSWLILVFLPIAAYSGVRRLTRVPPRAVRWAGWLLTGLVALLPLLVTFQRLNPPMASLIAMPAGLALGLLAALFLYSAPEWSPGSTVIPAGLALLAAAGLKRDSQLLVALYAAAGVLAAIHLSRARPIRALPFAVYSLVAGGIATGVCFLLPWAQPWVEGKAGDLLEPGKTARAGLSLTSRLGEIEELGLSSAIALRVWTDRPQYLRARAYTSFNGLAWGPSAARARQPLVASSEPFDDVPGLSFAVPGGPQGPGLVRTRILLDRPMNGVIPAPGQVGLVRLDEAPAGIDGAGVLIPNRAAPELYAVLNRYDGRVVQPEAPPTEDALDARAVTDVRLRELADRLRAGADPDERIRRTLAYLEERCTYSLSVGAFRSKDPVGEFVFDKRRGYCEYFASAATLLLRLQDIPARYVVGYSVRSSNLEGGHYVVREADAHAWVEAYVAGRGWVELDPTPAAQFEALRAPIRGGAIGGLWERVKSWISEMAAMIRLGAFAAAAKRAALVALGGVAVLAVAVVLFRSRRKRNRPEEMPVLNGGDPLPPELVELLSRLDRAWKKSGHPRPPSRGPLEHLESLPPGARIGRELVDALYRCRYGGVPPTREEIALLSRGSG